MIVNSKANITGKKREQWPGPPDLKKTSTPSGHRPALGAGGRFHCHRSGSIGPPAHCSRLDHWPDHGPPAGRPPRQRAVGATGTQACAFNYFRVGPAERTPSAGRPPEPSVCPTRSPAAGAAGLPARAPRALVLSEWEAGVAAPPGHRATESRKKDLNTKGW